jgi:poly(3-hydroxybutyrate) depolymerase
MMKDQNPRAFSMKWLMRVCVLALMPLLGIAAGCADKKAIIIPGQPNEIDAKPGLHDGYCIYLPKNYTPDHAWPMVISLHGAHGLDWAAAQIRDWRDLAEKHGFIVVAPNIRSSIGGPAVLRDLWIKDMAADEKSILSVLDEVTAKYRIDPKTVLLAGLSAGGFPLYYTALRHPDRFGMMIAMSCWCDEEVLEKTPLTPEVRKMPVVVYWGSLDVRVFLHCAVAVKYFSSHGFTDFQQETIPWMGHDRRPDIAYRYWDAKLLHPRPTP